MRGSLLLAAFMAQFGGVYAQFPRMGIPGQFGPNFGGQAIGAGAARGLNPNIILPGEDDGLMSSLAYGVSGSLSHNSNVQARAGGGDDTILSLSPWVYWQSANRGEARIVLSASYGASVSTFLNDSDRNFFGHNLNLNGNYGGDKVNASANVTYNLSQQSDVILQDLVETSNFGINVNGNYRYSDKTSFTAGLGYNRNSGDRADFVTSDGFNVFAGVRWQYSPLFTVGGNARWGRTTSGARNGDMSFFGLSATGNYRVTEKVSLGASVGRQWSDFDRGGGDSGIWTANVNLNYRIDEIWSVNAGLSSQVRPSPLDEGAYLNSLNFRAGVSRPFWEGMLTLGVNWNNFEVDALSGSAADGDTLSGWGVNVAFNRLIWKEQMSWFVSANYNDQDGRGGSFTSTQFTTGLGYTF